MECEQEKTELTVYAMDALDAEAADRVGSHVRGCPDCAAEVDEALATLSAVRLLPEEEVVGDWAGKLPGLREAAVRAALAERSASADGPASAERPGEEPPVLDLVAASGRPQAEVGAGGGAGGGAGTGAGTAVPAVPARRSWRPRQPGWAFAAAVAGVALGYGASLMFPAEPPTATTATARPAGASVVRATGADGIAASLEPRPTGWGTEVLLEVSGLDGPRRCVLVAVAEDGTEETALTWQVPEGGYGLPGSLKERLLAVGGLGMAPEDIAGYVIRTTGGEKLLDLPAAPGSS
ncbi:anti-sigma factor family protein [Streptomyces microflavus]|uniref:anti-sigma factor family protein n=1 Tax=Streptomyces microflavus TaxID=1919 RepID=UPI0038056223